MTGAAGFIGGHLANYLEASGVDVVRVGRRSRPPDDAALDVVVDLRPMGALDPFVDATTTVFHLAGSASVRASVEDPVATFHDSLSTTLSILESARRAGARVLLASSAAVCDARGPLPFSEEMRSRPPSPYAAAKLAAEGYGAAFHQTYGLDVRIARMFSVYGPGMRRFAIHDFCRRLIANPDRLTIAGDGGQTRDYLYVEDTVRALAIVAADGAAGTTYNIASGEPRTIRSVAVSVARAMGLPDATIDCDGKNPIAEPYRMEADVTRLQALGFRPSIDFERGIRQTVAWLTRELKGSASVRS